MPPSGSSQNPSDRIQVELELLSQTEMARLENFAQDFSRSINKLEALFGTFEDQIRSATANLTGNAAAGRAGAPTQAMTSGSQADKVREDRHNRQTGGDRTPAQKWAYYEGNMSAIEKEAMSAQRLGNMNTQDFLRLTSRAASHYSLQQEDITDAAGNIITPAGTVLGGRNRLARFSTAVGSAARLHPYGTAAIAGVSGLAGGVARPLSTIFTSGVPFGSNVGMARSNGIGGSQLWSSAQQEALGASVNAMKLSWAGMNPLYSSGAANTAMEAINNYGYSGYMRDALQRSLKTVQISSGGVISGPEAMSLLDPAIRFGGSSIAQFTKVLQQIPVAAEAARMSTSAYMQQLSAVAPQLAQQMGTTTAQSTQSIMQVTGATGFGPERATGVLGDQTLMFEAMMRTGQNLFVTQNSPMAGMQRLASVQQNIGMATGMSFNQLSKLRKTNPKAYSNAMNNLSMLALKNPQLLGGFSARELDYMIGKGNVMGVSKAIGELQTATHHPGSFDPTQIMRNMGYSKKQQAWWMQHHGGQDIKTQIGSLQSELGANRNHPPKYLIDLSPNAKKFFKLVSNPDVSNSNRSYANNTAMSLNATLQQHAGF